MSSTVPSITTHEYCGYILESSITSKTMCVLARYHDGGHIYGTFEIPLVTVTLEKTNLAVDHIKFILTAYDLWGEDETYTMPDGTVYTKNQTKGG
jgi:hypothetical protein